MTAFDFVFSLMMCIMGIIVGIMISDVVFRGTPGPINAGIYSCEYARAESNMVIFLAKKESGGNAILYRTDQKNIYGEMIADCNKGEKIAVVDDKIIAYRP